MSIPVKCTCGETHQIADHLAGTLVFCPNCRLSLDFPAPEHLPVVEDIEVLDEDESSAFYDVNEPLGDEGSPFATGSASGFGGLLSIIQTSREAACLAYSSGNRQGLAGIGRDVLILDMRRAQKVGRFKEHDEPVTALALSSNALAALSGDRRGGLLLWQVEARTVVRRLRGHHGAVLCCAIAPNGNYAISGGEDGEVRLWDLATSEEVGLRNSTWDEPVTALAYSDDGTHILAGTACGRIGAWSVLTGERLRKLRGGHEPIQSVAFSYDNTEIIAAGLSPSSENGAAAWRWLTHGGSPLPAFTNPSAREGELFCLSLFSRGGRIVVGAQWQEIIRNAQRGLDVDRFLNATLLGGPLAGVVYAAASPIGQRETVETRCGIQCLSVEGGIRGRMISGVPRPIHKIVVAPDGSRALGALQGGDLAVFAMPP